MNFGWTRASLVLASVVFGAGAAQADRIKNPTALFSGLDKITGRIVSFEVGVGETVQFGSLQMTPRACFTKPPNENPNTTSFVEVDDVGLDGHYKRIFSGWMFASSPGLHGVEHPVYDLWLVDCKGGTEVIAEPKDVPEELPPIQQEPPRQGQQPTGIIAPPGGLMAPGGAAPVETAPVQRPPRQVLPAQRTPALNNNRSNDR
ncbi:DUF2155 domain-containing protein [Microvirga flavescens]|uniref:DUF2155 domain-containing protein n=1 Tax=Microvirga flavescens TaxID=2249811 RepID=UPI001FE078EB|nr:DUF2155 domain-containing protein [Microvirga flavescens]